MSHDPALERVVRDNIKGEEEHFAVVVKDLADGSGVAIAPDRVFYAASLFKTWVMLEAINQRDAGLLSFDETYLVSDYYFGLSLNSGEAGACEPVSLGDAISRMLSYSDNVAANVLFDRVGAGNMNTSLTGLGLATSGFIDGSLPTNAADMALLLEAIARGGAVSPAASNEMLSLLTSESIDDRVPALLPGGTQVAHKTGSWESATHDAAVVFSPAAEYVIVVLTDYGYTDNAAERIARLSRAIYDHHNPT
jgi:beta-lactamase class A